MSNSRPGAFTPPTLETAVERITRFGCHAGHFNVVACLTPWAPGCAALPSGASDRWKCFLNITPRRAIAELLFQLRRAPEDLEIADAGDAIALATTDPGRSRALAFIWDLSADLARTALEELARGVKP